MGCVKEQERGDGASRKSKKLHATLQKLWPPEFSIAKRPESQF